MVPAPSVPAFPAQLRSGTTSYYQRDGLGSVTSLSNSAGAVAETYTYDSYGKPTASTGTVVNPFQYTGRELDSETGIYYYRARYFDPGAGRFLSQDPIRYRGGVNFYAYTQNRPVLLTDPSGYQGGCPPQSPNCAPTDPDSPYQGPDGLWYNVNTDWQLDPGGNALEEMRGQTGLTPVSRQQELGERPVCPLIFPNLIEEVDGAGNVLARYAQAWKADEPLAEMQSGTTSYYEQDGLSSVSSLSNGTGALANTYTYDTFGKLTASSGTLTNQFRYTGREFDQETGLYFYRARYFDQSVGRFISGDPVGFRGQDINLYRYVKNQPTGFVDPSGLVSIDPSFNPNCLHSLQRALNIVHHLRKKCDCAFSKIGTGRSFTDLINDPGITVHSAPNDDVTATGPNGLEGAFTTPGDTHNITLRPVACRFGAWTIAQDLVHEMVHITLVPGDNQEDQAYGMAATCGLSPLPTAVGVSIQQTEVPTITSDVPNQIPEQ